MAAARPTGLYRTLLRLARTLPKPKRDSVVADIKSKWQAVKSETNVDAINRHLHEANEQLRLLQATTAKPVAEGQRGVVTYVVKRGSIVKGKAETVEKAKHSTFGAGNVDPEAMQKHEHLMRRFHFMDR